jgi:hypothetical protein
MNSCTVRFGTISAKAGSSSREKNIQRANRKMNKHRYLLRLAKDLKMASIDSYGFSVEMGLALARKAR